MSRKTLILCGVLLAAAWTAGPAQAESAASLFRAARRAEKRGDLAEAYLKASQAVALAPDAAEYWNYSQALRTRALAALQPAPSAGGGEESGAGSAVPAEFVITPEELQQARRMLPPPVLRGREERQSFRLRENAKRLFESVAKAYGIEVVFDQDYPEGPPIRFQMDDADWREALRAVETVTSSFLVPLSERRALVAKDTAQKRAELEPAMNLLVPLPESLKTQDVQEVARAVQSAMDITKIGIDTNRRVVLFRDRVSKLRPAVALFEQLLGHKAQVTIDVELLAVTESAELNAGLAVRSSYPLAFLGNPTPFSAKPQAEAARMASFGGGRTQMAVTVVDGELFAALTRGQSRSLVQSRLRTLDGEQATLHIGDRYPIITAGFFGDTGGAGNVFQPPPMVNFEQLGVVLKLTPRVHNASEVSLELEAEFKSLAGQTLNGIPVISNRRIASRLRTAFHEAAIVTGVESESVSQSWSGLPVLSLVPGLRSDTRTRERSRLLLMVRTRLESLPPVETPVFPIRTGSETRPLTPLD
ncbi:MAG: hypothetical protein KatS3mg005_3634 [Bryobacteraceae bacterium]|nr:MAG: hypothetical protein KatS3mg005_3634 [Bryobacteraceae bacterium]